MQISLKSIKDVTALRSDCLIVPVSADLGDATASALDQATEHGIREIIKRGEFEANLGDTLYLPYCRGIKAQRVLLVGTGKNDSLSPAEFDKLIDSALRALAKSRCQDVAWLGDHLAVDNRNTSWQLTRLAQLLEMASYQYSKTLSKPRPALSIKRVTVAAANIAANKAAIAAGLAIGKGCNTARELGNLPANICTPRYLADCAKALGERHEAAKVSILDEKKMQQLGMGALLSVSAGSDEPARLIVIEYRGAAKTQPPHVLVGKGITFDTGGISLKPGAKMDEMKYDMCGAASVLGTMEAICEIGPKLNVVAIVAASENMPSGRATKPGDVVTSMSGRTIEVLNTDAEGRLVLCDALTYAARYKPASLIDIATLTGACVVALGKHAAGLFSNDDSLAAELLEAGQVARDRAWHMPLWDDYQPQLDSNFADMANIGGPEAGSVTAACFLSRFVKDQRWAHLDIAGAAWEGGANKGATGRPVGLLCQYLLSKAG